MVYVGGRSEICVPGRLLQPTMIITYAFRLECETVRGCYVRLVLEYCRGKKWLNGSLSIVEFVWSAWKIGKSRVLRCFLTLEV